jgi:pimeloyl-ACP methyl ester carboxylesterase
MRQCYRHLRLRRRRLWAVAPGLAVAAAAVLSPPAMASTTTARAATAGAATVATSSAATSPRSCLPAGQRKPVIVLVHGAWADTSSWSGEVAELRADGYDARAIANPLQGLTTDSEYVADYVKAISGPVILVGHSYGGAVISTAAEGLSNVKALVFVDASAPAPGEANGALAGATSVLNKLPKAQLFFTTTYPGAPNGAKELYLKENIFVRYFANSMPASQAELLWAQQRGAATTTFSTPSKVAAWRTIPSWYFISTGDQIITPQSELAMAHRAHSHVTLFHGGSHLTLISNPQAVTNVITSAICSLR